MAEFQKKDIDEKIRTYMDKEPIPEHLQPEQIEKMLQNRKPKRGMRKWISIGTAAAAAIVVGTVAILGGSFRQPGEKQAQRKQESKTITKAKQTNEEAAEIQQNGLVKGLKSAESYEQIRNLLYWVNEEKYGYTNEMKMESAAQTNGANSGYQDVGSVDREELAMDSATTENEEDYSRTNIQEEGVGEADILLTDGTYLYMCSQYKRENVSVEEKYGCYEDMLFESGCQISIVKPDPISGKLNHLSNISFQASEQGYPLELYLCNERLVVITNKNYDSVLAITYDITDRAHPTQIGQIEAEGIYTDSRLVDNNLYLFTQYGQEHICFSKEEGTNEEFIPCVQGEMLSAEDIYLPEIQEARRYLIGVSMSVENPNEVISQNAIMMNSSEFYVSRNNIYLAESNYKDETSTIINKLSYKDGKMEPVASGTVKGTLNDSFSMDEYNEYLRIVTTSEQSDISNSDSGLRNEEFDIDAAFSVDSVAVQSSTLNHLYVLDAQLNLVGKIENLAEGERIYSARFMGDTGFFVTYRQVDPLFSVDLSNPANPVILGELKVSGFSEYLHPYGDNRLLGIGWETSNDEFEDWPKRDAMKLSMFNTSDMSQVTEENRLLVDEVYEIPEDHRAILIHVNKNLFGMAVQTVVGRKNETHYLTFRYVEGKGFEQITDTLLENGYGSVQDIRGVYVNDILYILNYHSLKSVSLNDGTLLDTLNF